MKNLLRAYLGSLREREELDAILPDLLSELGYTVYSRPMRGTLQYGVDVGAIKLDENGEQRVYLFTIKPGDLNHADWDGQNKQSLRPSLNQIKDAYIPARIPTEYKGLKVTICVVLGGEIKENLRAEVTGYMTANTTERLTFEEWNGDRLAGLLMTGILREEIMPKELRSHFQKAVAMVDVPDIAYHHFAILAKELCKEAATDPKKQIRAARQIYIGLWVLYVWARDAKNLDAPYRASEMTLLSLWDLLRVHLGKDDATVRALKDVLVSTIRLNIEIASGLLETKILQHCDKKHSASVAVASRQPLDVNLRLFDMLGRIGLTGIWMHWILEHDPEPERREEMRSKLDTFVQRTFLLINNNPILLLPLCDQQAIDIALVLMMAIQAPSAHNDLVAWLQEMAHRLAFTLKTYQNYPCVFTEYADLLAHPKETTEAYREQATAASILVPLIAAFLAAFQDQETLKVLADLTHAELKKSNLQAWIPDEDSEERIYNGNRDHGTAVDGLVITETGIELLDWLKEISARPGGFKTLSAPQHGFWPLIATACRHYRLPPPPQLWLGALLPPET